MAVKYGADDIEEMVTDLSQMLRYSLIYQGLQQQLDDLIVQHLGVNFIGRAKRVGKPLLLNVQLMLRVKKKENNIEFSVLNNGNKMDLEKVKQALQLPEDAKPTSYGLRNVNDQLKPAFCPVVFDQPVIDIAQPVAGRLCILRQLQRLFHFSRSILLPLFSTENSMLFSFFFYAKHQLSGLTGFIKAVLQSVFYQGLQQQLDDLIVQHLGVNFIGQS